MRAFIAIDLPDDSFIKIQERLKDDAWKVGFSESFHITLRFLGEISADKIQDIMKKLGSVRFEAFTITTGKLDAFPEKDLPKIVWMGLKRSPEIIGLKVMIDKCLSIEKDKEFIPHITLGRAKHIDDVKQASEIVKNTVVETEKYLIDRFCLYKSTLTPHGPRYDVLREYLSK